VTREQIPALVAQKLERLGRSSEFRRGAAVTAILSRHFVLAGPGWTRWPEWVIANRLADENGGVLSHGEADRRVAATDDWREARAFFDGL
jgi:hypothetical protein